MDADPGDFEERQTSPIEDFKELADEVRELQDERLAQFSNPADYKRHVLPMELEFLRGKGERPFPSPKLLILLCGTVPPPLLLSIAYASPDQVLLVGSDSAQGRDAVGQVIQHLDKGLKTLTPVYIHPSEPVSAYKDLVGRLSQELRETSREQILMDITGGKKTMTMAAFLAASQLSLRILYVDGEYEPRLRLPKPCTSSITVVEDPAVVFWLRERKEAVRLFDEGSYWPALDLMKRIAKGLHQGGRPDEAQRVQKACAGVQAAAQWEEALYEEATKTLKDAGQTVPSGLQALAALWRHHQDRLAYLARNHKGEGVLRFAADRLGWAQREHKRGQRRRSFLAAYMACDTALEAIRYNENPTGTNHIRHESPGEQTLRQRYSSFEQGNAVREHRNALVHRIEGPNNNHVDRLLFNNADYCIQVLKAVGTAFGCANTDAILANPLDGLETLRPSALENA